MKITYNAPFTLTFTLLASLVYIANYFTGTGLIANFFTAYPAMNFSHPLTYFRLFSHVLGHANIEHLSGNLLFILLLGPILEEKYGSIRLTTMALITALITGLLNTLLFNTGLLGASGIVFMLILLSSFVNFRSGEIPLTFILIMITFLSREVYSALFEDNISQFAHIIGGLCGSWFGFRKNGG
ncbi:MAG TPA: rhomboid family intramembrane serine protease [Bacteroidetes bacterium]|nr:rhomboid family intramembrane serine protease [Bacteroidota bacterium]